MSCPCGLSDPASTIALMPRAQIGDLVPCTNGKWIVLSPKHCPDGHPLRPGHIIVSWHRCRCELGGHYSWECECGAVTYGRSLGEGCRIIWAHEGVIPPTGGNGRYR